MSKALFIHGTIRGNGHMYIPHTFLTRNNLPHSGPVTFTSAPDGLSFELEICIGRLTMRKGIVRLGIKKGNEFIRAMMENKPDDYPYPYKGVYVLSILPNGLIHGELVQGKVSNIPEV